MIPPLIHHVVEIDPTERIEIQTNLNCVFCGLAINPTKVRLVRKDAAYNVFDIHCDRCGRSAIRRSFYAEEVLEEMGLRSLSEELSKCI